jgi:hypothetical protein
VILRLYELTSIYQQLVDQAEELDAQTLADTLESLQDEIEDKAESLAYVIRTIEAESKIVKEEEERLKKKRQSLENNAKNLKLYLFGELQKARVKSIKRPTVTIAIQKNAPSVNVISEDLVPDNYKIVPAPVLDKKGILAALKMGEEIEGVQLQQSESIRIK